MTLATTPTPRTRPGSRRLQQIKKALCQVDCLPKPVPSFATFREQRSPSKQMKGLFRTGWQMDYPYIENFLQPLYQTGASSNDGDYTTRRSTAS